MSDVRHLMSEAPRTTAELDALIASPSERATEALRQCPGDIAVLGAGGKMGFHLCLMLARALKELGDGRRLVAVSRFGSESARDAFRGAGIGTHAADLADPDALAGAPSADNVFYLAGAKFGTGSDAALLHRMNVAMPALVAERFSASRIVALSTGCVYSFTEPASGGSTEEAPTDPPGDYARSCIGRETAFVEAARRRGTRSALVRLNYSNDLRYGVLVDIAQQVLAGEPVEVEMGHVNLIWQGDALDHIVQCLPRAAAPPFVINVTGGEVLAVRELAAAFGRRLGIEPKTAGREAPSAWLSNPARSHALFGPPRITTGQMIAWTADWLARGGETLGKPTHFENREGRF